MTAILLFLNTKQFFVLLDYIDRSPSCAPNAALSESFHVQVHSLAFDCASHIVGDGVAVALDVKQGAQRYQVFIHCTGSVLAR